MNNNESISATDAKKLLRTHFKEIRRSVPEGIKSKLNNTLVDLMSLRDEFKAADTVLLYYPTKEEPNFLRLAEIALSEGKKVGFPITHVKERKLVFHQISSLSDLTDMTKGAYGICEPSPELPILTELSGALCIVPALSYDTNGNRLGYGGGYYDRFLSEYTGKSAVLIYSCLYSPELPTDRYDVKVDMIITEKGGVFINEKT